MGAGCFLIFISAITLVACTILLSVFLELLLRSASSRAMTKLSVHQRSEFEALSRGDMPTRLSEPLITEESYSRMCA